MKATSIAAGYCATKYGAWDDSVLSARRTKTTMRRLRFYADASQCSDETYGTWRCCLLVHRVAIWDVRQRFSISRSSDELIA